MGGVVGFDVDGATSGSGPPTSPEPPDIPEAVSADAVGWCEPPRHLAVRAVNDYGGWHLEAQLNEANGVTELRFTQHLDAQTNVGDVGPGWEYYLDNLVASRTGDSLPDFNDYCPAQKAYYLELSAGEA